MHDLPTKEEFEINRKPGDRLEKTKFWLDPALSNLELLHATFVTHSFARHVHDGFAIGVIVEGAETFEYRRGNHVAPAGSVVVINPGEIHTGQAVTKNGWTYRMLYPEAEMLQQAASQVTGRPCDVPFFASPVIQDSPLAEYLLKFHHALEEPSSVLERQSHLLWIFGQLIVRHAGERPRLRAKKPGQEHQAVKRVQEYLEAHFPENLLLDELSQVANLSQFHMLRVFRREIGLPPHVYLTQVRIAHAKTLLAKGWPITTVAQETGFVDQSHLTRQFKRSVGVTPGQYLLNSKNLQDRPL